MSSQPETTTIEIVVADEQVLVSLNGENASEADASADHVSALTAEKRKGGKERC